MQGHMVRLAGGASGLEGDPAAAPQEEGTGTAGEVGHMLPAVSPSRDAVPLPQATPASCSWKERPPALPAAPRPRQWVTHSCPFLLPGLTCLCLDEGPRDSVGWRPWLQAVPVPSEGRKAGLSSQPGPWPGVLSLACSPLPPAWDSWRGRVGPTVPAPLVMVWPGSDACPAPPCPQVITSGSSRRPE